MRTLLIASAAIAAMTAGDASAQRTVVHGPGAPYAAPGATPAMAPPPRVGYARGNRWGSKVNGHWWGGMNAPGGWGAYRRPYRGWHVPNYWVSPRFVINDWSDYGLSQPPYGYNWARYYDDAILIDDRGGVYDTVGGVDWDGYAGSYGGTDTVYSATAGAGYAQPAYAPQGYAQPAYGAPPPPAYAPPPPPPGPDCGYGLHRSNGVGGALVGAAVGGVAGNVIAGRGNRLGGTLIGAGVGGVAGYAVDRGSGRHRGRYDGCYAQPPVAPPYAPPPSVGYAPPPPPPPVYAPPPPRAGWVSPDGATTVTTTSAYGGSTTTVVVQSAPVVTTTTTEIVEDAVTYSPRPVWHKRVWHKPVRRVWHRPACGCR